MAALGVFQQREERSYFLTMPFLQYVGMGADETGGWWNGTHKANLANTIDRSPHLCLDDRSEMEVRAGNE